MIRNKRLKLEAVIIENHGNYLTASDIYRLLCIKFKKVVYTSANSIAHSDLKKINLTTIKTSKTVVKKYLCDKYKCKLWNDKGLTYRKFLKID